MWRKRDVDRRVSAAQPGRGFYGGGRALRCDVHSVWAASEQSAGRHVAVGNGQLFCTAYSREALRTLGVAPDREVPSSQNASVDYIHRRTSYTGIYFIRNTQPTLLQTPVTLRVDGKQPGLLENHLPRGDHRRSHATAGRIRLPLGQQIPLISAMWRRHWARITPFFAFPPEIQKITYTTNNRKTGGYTN